MKKKLDSKRIQELNEIFEKIHTEYSKCEEHRSRGTIYNLLPTKPSKFNEEYNRDFIAEIKPILLSAKKEYNEKLVGKKSFLFTKHWGTNLALEDYLFIVEKSNSYYEYLLILFENNYTNFSLRELSLFCLKYIFNDYIALEVVIDIKEISYKSPYTHIKEPKKFQNVENFWKEKDYGKVFWEENNILVNLMKEYWKENWEEPFKNKKIDIPKVLKKILNDHKIPQLTDAINKIIDLFSDIRNMLGKEEGETKKNKEWINSFENSLEVNRKVNTRVIIDLMKSIHNLIVISNIERNRN